MKLDPANPAHRAVIQAARSWGVPPSVFMGEGSGTVTTYEYDVSGRLVRAVSAPPTWSADDQDAALDLLAYEANLCPGCRHPLDETTRPEHEYAYRAEEAIRCHRCTASQRAGEHYGANEYSSALFIPIVLRAERETARETDTDAG